MNNELTAENTLQIRFRCPCCQKLYCSDTSSFALNPIEASEFECFSCQNSFFLYQTKTENGMYRTEKTNHVEFSKCPKCDFLKPHKQDECSNCGILESKFKEIQKLENPRLFEIEQAWNMVISDFTNDEHHQKFLNLAQSHMALNFASQKYVDLKKMMGLDPLIEKYLKQIELRLSAMIQTRFEAEKNTTVQSDTQIASAVSRMQNVDAKYIFMAVSLLGTALLIYNKINPTFPNLTGLIVAATVLSYGLWFISLNKSKI
jgi:hypothetical protein